MTDSMRLRLAGVLALLGGAAWLAKVAIIWANDGKYATEGVAGALLLVGFAAIASSVVARAWSRKSLWRVVAVVVAPLALVAAIDLPIPLAWLVIGRTWPAEEVGIVMVAGIALVVGVRWAR